MEPYVDSKGCRTTHHSIVKLLDDMVQVFISVSFLNVLWAIIKTFLLFLKNTRRKMPASLA